MPDPLNYRPSSGAVHYVPPTQIHFGRIIVGFAGAAFAAIIGAYVYGRFQENLDNFYLRGGAVALVAIGVGVLALIPVRYGRIRNLAGASTVGALLSLLTLYVMWLVWVQRVLRDMFIIVSYRLLIIHPIIFLRLIKDINRSGTWSYRGNVSNGFPLLVMWLGEAGIIMAAGVIFAMRGVYTSDPVCRECGSQCKRVPNFPRFATDRQSDFLSAIENREFAALPSQPVSRSENAPELSLRLMSCPQCKATNVLTVNRIAWILDSNRRAKVKIDPLIDQLLITPEEAEELKVICMQIKVQREVDKEAAE